MKLILTDLGAQSETCEHLRDVDDDDDDDDDKNLDSSPMLDIEMSSPLRTAA
jgi:hypothetical protein